MLPGVPPIDGVTNNPPLTRTPSAYPASVSVEASLTSRNRLTTAFRLILAIPHLILVGGVAIGVSYRGDSRTTAGSEGGLLGAVAVVLAIVSWFTIVLTSLA